MRRALVVVALLAGSVPPAVDSARPPQLLTFTIAQGRTSSKVVQ